MFVMAEHFSILTAAAKRAPENPTSARDFSAPGRSEPPSRDFLTRALPRSPSRVAHVHAERLLPISRGDVGRSEWFIQVPPRSSPHRQERWARGVTSVTPL